jgi:hypothetical protein
MPQPFIKCAVRAEGQDEFNRLQKQMAQFNKRQPEETCVAKAYFIDLATQNATKFVSKEKIRENLTAPSTEHPEVELAPILINWQLGKKGKKGLTGAKMATAVEKYIKKRERGTQAGRSGWLPGQRTLNAAYNKGDVNFNKRFAPKKPQGIKQYGKDKGYAQITRRDGYCSVTVANTFGTEGKQASPTIDKVLEDGLDTGFARENTQTISFLTKKYQAEFDRQRRINTYHG